MPKLIEIPNSNHLNLLPIETLVATKVKGIRRDRRNNIIGLIPASSFPQNIQHEDDSARRERVQQEDAQLRKAMSQWNMAGCFWRVARFERSIYEHNVMGVVCAAAWTLGLFLVVWPILHHVKKRRQMKAIDRPNEVLLSDRDVQRGAAGVQFPGWAYDVVPEIAIDWTSGAARGVFERGEAMLALALAAIRQKCLVLGPRREATTVPGGDWARQGRMEPNAIVRLKHDFFWLITVNEDNEIETRRYEHGLSDEKLCIVRGTLLKIERDCMVELLKSGFQGSAIAVWPQAREIRKSLDKSFQPL